MKRGSLSLVLWLILAPAFLTLGAEPAINDRMALSGTWQMQSSVLEPANGSVLSRPGNALANSYSIQVPTTVLNALVKQGVYPDPRFGLNGYQIPDSSDEFNQKFDLAKYSHLPDQRNPWRDPWWFRREFALPPLPSDRHVWLHFDSINYRAEVWLNGQQIANREDMVSMNQRFLFDISREVVSGTNCLAVEVWRVDHVGSPGPQLVPLGNLRFQDQVTEGPMDYAVQLAGGYDCFPSIPDRYLGILQDVWLEFSGPVTLRDPFIVTELPLPETNRATLKISTTLLNGGSEPVHGTLRGSIPEAELRFEQPVALSAGEQKEIQFDPAPVMKHPKLWWPNGYGAQPQYDLKLQFLADGKVSHEQTVRFGVRQITTQLHERNGHYGRRILVNGQKIFARGGYIQPDALWDWTPERTEAEVRYYAEANLNLVYFEDIANPPDYLLDGCDRHGVMIGQCFYGCSWMETGTKYPADVPLVVKCTRDILKRYRNHPSLVMYMASNEGFTREEVYAPWRASVVELDGSRFWIPSNGMPDAAPQDAQAWFRADLPTGMTDNGGNTYQWQEPSEYYRRVREMPTWMFMVESGSASLPPVSSLAKFLPKLGETAPGPIFPLDAAWAHHGANDYYKPYDAAVRRLYGQPATVGDYAWQAHLVTADQNRAMFEAVNHRLWDITSGFTQWKINSAWPDVQWQIFDWFLKPMVSYYFIKRANEPVHIQLGLIEPTVTVVNHSLARQAGLKIRARVYDPAMHLLCEKYESADVAENSYRDVFKLPQLPDLPPVYFVRLDLSAATGKRLSDNFYWLPAQKGGALHSLHALPPVRLQATCKIEARGKEQVARVKITNPTRQLAFFVQLALTRGQRGAEILPVLWEDNYFSLLPGESRELTARVASAAVGDDQPKLELGGWNVETEFECLAVEVPPQPIKAAEPLQVTASVGNTFLDGSRVFAYWDGKPTAQAVAFARGSKSETISFLINPGQAGTHQLRIGQRQIQVIVQP